MDQILVSSGLYGRGLVPIDTAEGIARYNEALAALGCKPTSLSRIGVDGIGWSPEVAAEQGNRSYLSHGPSNQCGIVFSPDQERKPHFYPEYTFLRPAMMDWFRRNKREAADVTTDESVRVTFDLNVSEFASAKDLLLVDKLVVQSATGLLGDMAKRQQDLLAEYQNKTNGWFDSALLDRIIESGKPYGDLTRRHLEIPDLTISQLEDFWARVFGGVFVLSTGMDKILIVEDETLLDDIKPDKGERYHAFCLSDPRRLIEHLVDEHLIEFDPAFYAANQKELLDLSNYLSADFICRVEPECDLHSMSKGQRSGILNDRKSERPELLPQLERFRRSLSGGLGSKAQQRLPDDLELMLMRPTVRAGDSAHPILRMILLRLQDNPVDMMRLYRYDKERFFALFEEWPLAKKRWAAKYVSENYQSEMSRRETKEVKS